MNSYESHFAFGVTDLKILQNQTIDENGPGTIQKDFEILLDFIGTQKIAVTKKHNLLPLKLLNPLNAQLTFSLNLGVERPTHKSFPNIEGLYVILRSTGLGIIDISEGKPILALDKEVLRLWHELNPTERYFTLLETWLIRSRIDDILGDRIRSNNSLLQECLFSWRHFPNKKFRTVGNKNFEELIRYSPGLINIALMQLFGMVEIEHGDVVAGKGWQISRLKKLPFGDAVFKLLFKSFMTNPEYLLNAEEYIDDSFGKLQLIFRPYFPEWKNNLLLPETEFKDGIHIFKVSMGRVWRRIAIPAKMTCDDLCDVILDAFEFDKDHLYEFTFKNRFGNIVHVNAPQVEEPPFTTDVKIGELPLQVGSTMTFLFDFGDNWEFGVKLEQINPVDIKPQKAKIIEKHGDPYPQYPDWDEDEWEDEFE